MAKGNPISNFPTNQKPKATPEEIGWAVGSFEHLRELEPVKKHDVEGLKNRLDFYFQFCEERGVKPSVEGLTLAVGCSRQNLWLWEQDGSEAGKLITRAKNLINCMLTDFALNGKLAFPYAIWLQKNHFQYHDNTEITVVPEYQKPLLTAEELPKLRIGLGENDGGDTGGGEELPDFSRAHGGGGDDGDSE